MATVKAAEGVLADGVRVGERRLRPGEVCELGWSHRVPVDPEWAHPHHGAGACTKHRMRRAVEHVRPGSTFCALQVFWRHFRHRCCHGLTRKYRDDSIPLKGGTTIESCVVGGCNERVTKKGHTFCYAHWQAEKERQISACDDCGVWKDDNKPKCLKCFRTSKDAGATKASMTSSQLGERLGTKAQRINLLFQELGWITRERKGWVCTKQGKQHGATVREHNASGVPFVVWPEAILEQKLFRSALNEVLGLREDADDSIVVGRYWF